MTTVSLYEVSDYHLSLSIQTSHRWNKFYYWFNCYATETKIMCEFYDKEDGSKLIERFTLPLCFNPDDYHIIESQEKDFVHLEFFKLESAQGNLIFEVKV